MKNFLLTFFISFSFIYIVSLLIYILVDPYYENNIMINGLNKEKIQSTVSTSRVLRKKLNRSQYNLIFGTSRSAKIDDNTWDASVLNFSSSVYGNPMDVYEFLEQLNSQQIKNIQKIYYLLDNHVFKKRYNDAFNYQKSTIGIVMEQIKMFDFDRLYLTFQTLYINLVQKNPSAGIKLNGAFYNKSELPAPRLYMFNYFPYKTEIDYKQEYIDAIGKIYNFCIHHNIDIIFYTPTVNIVYLNNINQKKFIELRKKVLTQIPSLLDLSYIEDISNDTSKYTDVGHVNAKTTKYLFENFIIYPDKKYIVTKENANVYYNNMLSNITDDKEKLFLGKLK